MVCRVSGYGAETEGDNYGRSSSVGNPISSPASAWVMDGARLLKVINKNRDELSALHVAVSSKSHISIDLKQPLLRLLK